MGYLTTFTIRNDGTHLLKELSNAEKTKLINDLYYACTKHNPSYISVGGFVNMIDAQSTQHADDNTVYVNYGNKIQNINPYDAEIDDYLEMGNIDYLKDVIKTAKKS